jgi:hypothetical protein
MGEMIALGVALDEGIRVDVALGPGPESRDSGAANVFTRFGHVSFC